MFKEKRNVPFVSLPQINEELDRLERAGLLSKIEYNQWASPTVYVKEKSKEIQVCADFSMGPNLALKDYHYLLPSPEEIFAKLNEGNFFPKIDLRDVYLQIAVVEDCSKLLCINAHRVLYKLGRLPFGVKVALAIFQQVMDTMLSDLDFAVAYLVDILMNSQNVEQHKEHLHKVFSRIQEYGFKLKEFKCDFFMEKIKYLGHIIDKDSRRPNPEEATTIKDMAAPENVSA